MKEKRQRHQLLNNENTLDENSACFFIMYFENLANNTPEKNSRFHIAQSIPKFHPFHKNYFPIK